MKGTIRGYSAGCAFYLVLKYKEKCVEMLFTPETTSQTGTGRKQHKCKAA